jgi:predicted PurR-regulated permease PerM
LKPKTNCNHVFFIITATASLIIVSPFAMALSIGLILGFLSENTINKLCTLTKASSPHRRMGVSGLFVLSITLLVLLPLLTSIFVSMNDLAQILSSTDLENSISAEKMLSARNSVLEWISQFASHYGISLSPNELTLSLASWLASASRSVALFLGSKLAATPWLILQIVLALASWIVFGASGQKLRSIAIPRILPWESQRKIVCETVETVVRSLFVAGSTIAITQAILVTIVLGALNIPRFFILGFISLFMSFIPVFGTGVVMFPVALYLLSNNRPIAAATVAISAVLIGLTDNILRPWLMRDGLPFGFFWIFLSILGGITVFGFAGMLIGPILFALLVASVRPTPNEADEAVTPATESSGTP